MTSATEKTLLAIDPGSEMSAWVCMDYVKRIISYDFQPNAEVLAWVYVRHEFLGTLVIEDMKCYGGAAVGDSVLVTCKWMGRFQEANGGQAVYITNSTIRQQICHSSKARDCHIRQALIDRYGGQDMAIGKKKNPGPLYGMKQNKHHWSALAVGVTFLEQRQEAAR